MITLVFCILSLIIGMVIGINTGRVYQLWDTRCLLYRSERLNRIARNECVKVLNETSIQPTHYVELTSMQKKVNAYRDWDEARRMVINYLKDNHGLSDQYQWAFKTIDLLKTLKTGAGSSPNAG